MRRTEPLPENVVDLAAVRDEHAARGLAPRRAEAAGRLAPVLHMAIHVLQRQEAQIMAD